MRYLSVCSGIESASVAWEPLGWTPAGFAEVAPFPSAVLAHHWPHVRNFGDFTRIAPADVGPIDLLVGGTPCQSFSVAGLRGGMADARGNLALEYLALAGRLRPRWLVWENVPGVLSSSGGRDFGAFLGGLAELGYGFCYRVLDAQYFGVAQRRARVFVVGHLGDWRRAAAVLLERSSLRGDPAPSREAGEGSAYDAAPSIGASGRGFSRAGETRGQDPVVAHALRGDGFDASEDGAGRGTPLVSMALNAHGGSGRLDAESETLIPFDTNGATQCVAFNLRGRDGGAMPELSDLASIRAASGGSSRSYAATRWGVRRITPTEAERLQGFPDGWTAIPKRTRRGKDLGRTVADGPRYKAIGNSMAVPVMAWIGSRIESADREPTTPN